jgi:hypothetical protein
MLAGEARMSWSAKGAKVGDEDSGTTPTHTGLQKTHKHHYCEDRHIRTLDIYIDIYMYIIIIH